MKGDKLIFKIILFSLSINVLVHLAIYLSTDSRFDTKKQSAESQSQSQSKSMNDSFDMDLYLSKRTYELDKKLDVANFYIIMLFSILLSIAALKIRELSDQVRRLETKIDQVNSQFDGEPSILNKRD